MCCLTGTLTKPHHNLLALQLLSLCSGIARCAVPAGQPGRLHDALVRRGTPVHVQVDRQLALPRTRALRESLLPHCTAAAPPRRARALLLHALEEVSDVITL